MDQENKIFTTDDRVLIYHLKNILLAEGIECYIKNDMMYTLAGEVPVDEVLPELWITNAAQYDVSKKIMDKVLHSDRSAEKSWICASCGEAHDGQFTSCWKCGAEHHQNQTEGL